VKSKDARNAIDALLSDRPVPLAETRAFGCTTKWLSKASGVEQEWARIQAEPVTVDMVGAEDLKKLRANSTDKVTVAYLWATGCAACTSQIVDLETTYRMFRKRAFNLVTINTNAPSDAAAVLNVLKKEYASSPNKQFATADRTGLQAAWGETWNLGAPLTMVIAPGGTVLYKKEGKIDIHEVRRIALASMPDTGYVGSQAYWKKALAEAKK
jgi:peroxiredoxin